MKQLELFDKWYYKYINRECHQSLTTHGDYRIITNIEENVDAQYPEHIHVSFKGLEAKQIFSSKEHFLNYYTTFYDLKYKMKQYTFFDNSEKVIEVLNARNIDEALTKVVNRKVLDIERSNNTGCSFKSIHLDKTKVCY